MNLSALARKLSCPPVKTARPSPVCAIEPLEARIAPASLINPTTVTFQDKNGDAVTVTISKPLFTPASVAKVFTFDTPFNTGSANGVNSTPQQLELLNIDKLGAAAKGIDISITAVPVAGSPGLVNVGYINAGGVDLGDVTVGGDLGRIHAGDLNFSTGGLHSLTVDSLGAQGLATQLPNGNLVSKIAGGVGSITVNGNIDGASIGIGGGAKGLLGSLLVTGNINGGTANFSGSVRTQGGITNVEVDGSITGGGGLSSGVIGTAGALGTVLVKGSVTGGGGVFSGAILSTKAMQSVTIDGNLTGGSGNDSGQVGTASSLGSVIVEESVNGGGGKLSGAILATGNITTAAIDDDLIGGAGAGSGQVGSGASIGTVTIIGSMFAGSEIRAHQNIGSVSISPGVSPGLQPLDSGPPGIANSFVIADTGSIGSITAADIANSGINAGGSIGSVNSSEEITGSVFIAGIDLGANFGVTGAGTFDNTSAASFGFGGSKSAVAAQIGNITADYIGSSTFLAGVHGPGPDGKFGTKDDSVPTGSSIGTITSPGGLNTVFVESGNIGATTSGEIVNTAYLSTDTAVTGAGIGPITVTAYIPSTDIIINPISPINGQPSSGSGGVNPFISTDSSHGIYNSTFTSNANIGAISVTFDGYRQNGENAGISSSTFLAGHALGTITVANNAFGSGGTNYGIVNSTFNGGIDGYGGAGDLSVTLSDSYSDGNSAAIANSNFDSSVCSCMSANMGAISAENDDPSSTAAGIVDSVFRVHGNIGSISSTMLNGTSPTAAAIQGSTFSAFGSIGDINVYGAVLADANGPSRFLAGYDIGADMTFGNEDLSAKSLALEGGQSIGNVTVTGAFQGSDMIASINPGAGYVFGDSTTGSSASNDSNVGSGGSIGLVSIGANFQQEGSPFTFDHATSHGIEAANFALNGESSVPTVYAFGYTSEIPVVLYVDGGSGDVRITNLTQADT